MTRAAQRSSRAPIALSLLAILMAYSACAGAFDATLGGVSFSLSGYGTLGAVHSSENQADFTASVFKPNGAGYTHAWSADVDSVLGAQVTANFTPRLSAVLQVVAEQNADNSYSPHVEWANIKYQFTSNFNVRIGRSVLPVFLASDDRKVAYANPWVRPPLEVYGLVPITGCDGVDVNYFFRTGEFKHTLQGSYGNKEPQLTAAYGGGHSTLKRNWSISDTIEDGALTVHLVYLAGNLTISGLRPLFNGFRQFGPQGIAIADRYEVDNTPLSFMGLGASYDPGNWFVMGEGGTTAYHPLLGNKTAGYISGGYRVGEFTPYITYARAKADHLSDPGLTVSAVPLLLSEAATTLNNALNSVLRTKPVQNTISIGVRWDFMKNTDFKMQFDHIAIGAGSTGVLLNTQPGFQPGGKVDVVSLTVDFVF